MTDKTKLDEAVVLTMNSDQGEIQMSSTVQADDLVELAMLLKNSGIVADDFQGPANLTSDEEGISTTVTAPNLRAIMNMLEPVFQAAGDMEADMVEPECDQAVADPDLEQMKADDLAAQQAQADYDSEMDMDDARAIAHDDLDAAFDDGQVAGVELYDPGMDPYGVDAEPEVELEPEMEVEEEAEYDYRTHDVHPHEYEQPASKEIVQPVTKDVPARSSDNPIVETPKTFADYVKEAELNELSKGAISRYTKKVNDTTGDEDDDQKLMKRGRGLQMAGDKVHWKDAKVLATETTYESLMAELNRELGEDLALKKMGNHEITFSDPADDEIEDLENDSPEKRAQVVKDISADMHEDGEMRRMPPRPTDFNSVASRAREDSKNGYVQHVNRHEDGQHSVSDWMSDDTVASFSNGQHIGGQDIEEEAEAAPQYEIQGDMCDYKIVDTTTGEVVADGIFSGHEAHNLLYWYNNEKKS